MIRKYLSIILSIIALLGVIFVTAFWIRSFYASVKNYRSPLQDAALLSHTVDIPQRTKVVVVLVSGLGDDSAQLLDLPILGQIAQTSAATVIQSLPPTYSQPARVSLVTGAWPEINGIPPLDLPIGSLRLLEMDTIFSQAHQAGRKTALLGLYDWRYLIPRNHLDETFFVELPGAEADQAIIEEALLLLQDNDIDLMFIHLTQLEFAAKHMGGTASGPYQQAAQQVDAYLGQISRAVSESVLVIVSDHGHTEDGGYGGSELEITRQPLIITGDPIAPGVYSDVNQADIAPTITTLLGVAPPTATQGRILFEALRLDDKSRAAAQLALARQRVNLVKAYLAALHAESAELPAPLTTDLEQAEQAFTRNNFSGASQLSKLAQETADTLLAATRHSQIRVEQLPRLLLAGVVLLIWSITMWRRRGKYSSIVIITAIITVGLYHILYQLQGFEYSLSALTNLDDWPFSVARRTAVSLLAGGGLLLILLMLTHEENWLTLLGTGYGFGVLVTFMFALPLFWAFWQNGFTVQWYLPSVDVVFWQVTSTFEAMIAAILGLILPWPIMMLNIFVNRIRRSLDSTQSQAGSDPMPGLRL